MGKEIDEKVVSMKFDNKQFMDKTSESMTQIEKLKNSLQLSGAAKGFDEVNKAAGNTNLSPLQSAAEQVGLKFNAMQVMAATALSNITNSAVNAGKRIVSAFTIDPIKTGLQEYETQINAVQTILANTESKGTTMADVNNALDELNAYADKTIYNFTEMTRNIGTFTAAGVELDTATNAIKGIANLAAVSGSNSQQASTAMYQLSQALSSGTVKLMDWNSVVNAGMGGQVFQDALKETARVHDIAIDDMIEEQGSFRETLSEGWLTSEILTETLSHFTMAAEEGTEQWNNYKKSLMDNGYSEEQALAILKLSNTATDAATKVKTFTQLMDTLKEAAQSGWTQTWEILIGDFETAKEMWSKVSDVFSDIIGKSAKNRNDLLKAWADGGGRDALFNDETGAFVNVWKALLAIITPIKAAFREIFPPTTAAQLIKITEGIRDFTKSLILSEGAQKVLKSTFMGLFAVLDIVVTLIKEVAKGAWTIFKALLGVFTDLAGSVGGLTGSFGEWLVELRDSVKSSGIFATVVGGIVKVFLKLVDVIKLVIQYLKDSKIFTTIFAGIGAALKSLSAGFKAVFSSKGFEVFLSALTAVWNGIKWVFGKIKDAVGAAGSAFLDAFRAGDFKRALDIFNTGILSVILFKIKDFIGGFGDFVGGFKGILDSVTGVLDGVRDCLKAYQTDIKAGALLKIAKAMAILVASIVVITFIDEAKLKSALGAMAMLFGMMTVVLAIMTKFIGSTKSFFNKDGKLIGQTVKHISDLAAVGGLILSMSVAMLILASALKKLSGMDPNEMMTGFIALAGLMGVIVAFVKVMSKTNGVVLKGVGGLISFALALKILVTVCKDLAKMDYTSLAVGMASLAAMMLLISKFINSIQYTFSAKEGFALIELALALNLMISVIKKLGGMEFGQLIQGIGGLAGILLALSLALKHISGPGIVKGAAGLVIAASALMLMVVPLRILGAMGAEQMLTSLYTLGIALAALTIALNALSGPGVVKGAAALVVAASALMIMAVPLRILGGMSLTGIGIALLALAGTFVVFGLAGLALGPIVPIILALSGAIALLGVGVLAVGVGISAFASGLAILAVSAAAGAAGLVAALGIILTGVIGLGAVIAQALATLITGICSALANSVGAICDAVAAIIVAVCNAIIKALPAISQCLGVLLDALLDIILKYVPKIVNCGIELIIALLDGIAQRIGDVVQKGVEVVAALLKGIGSQIGPIVSAAFKLILDLINGLSDAIATYTPLLIDACIGLGKSICEGIGYGIGAGVGSIWEMIKSVGRGIIDGFKKTLGINSPAKVMIPIGQGIDEGTALGMEKYKGVITDATEDIGKTAVKSMSNAISGISDVINSDMDSEPVIRPVIDLSGVESGASAINGMFGMTPSVGVLSNVGAINSMMGNRQNGGNFDVISAIKDLGNKISEMSGNSYVINGITYDDGSNITNAVKSIVRAARIERRIH